MSIKIDTQSVIVAIILINLFMILFIYAYRHKLKPAKPVKVFLYSKYLFVAAYILFALQYILPIYFKIVLSTVLSVLLSNLILNAGIALECIAVLMVIGTFDKRITLHFKGIALTTSVLFGLAFFSGEATGLGNTVLYAMNTLMLYPPVVRLLFHKNRTVPQRFAGVVYFLIMITFACKTLLYSGIYHLDAWSLNDKISMSSFALFVLMILSNTVFLLIVKENADLELERVASTDGLTGILNRNTFNERMENSLRYAARKNTQVSFILLDIDYFKRVNDTYGHFAGDTLLKDIAAVFSENMRVYDLFGRYGGDEFVVFLPGTNDVEATLFADRMRKAVENMGLHGNTKMSATISMGIISIIPEDETTVERLYKQADDALYDAKHQGGNCFVLIGAQTGEDE